MSKTTPAARSKARRFVLQALYQMSLSGCSSTDVETQFFQDHDMKRVDTLYLHELLTGINANRTELKTAVATKLDREFDELDPVESAALYVGAYELLYRMDIPYRVSISESVELAKKFGASESYKLVNTVLDELAKTHRQAELKQP
ncbi:MAG: transcription antitermination factor NusB [Pseudomonadales bacterium]|nr:transcription antitermination factor NusB [Pseudomonadales bacterium]